MVDKEAHGILEAKMEETDTPQDSDQEKTTTGDSPDKSLKRPAPTKDVKNSRKKPKTEHVHLPASDVRSNYHRIFETIFNGCQKSIASKHFRSVCIEDCILVSRSINNPFGPNYREVRGIDSMVEYVDTSLEAIPDCIFAILDTKFFRKPQAESMIISSYTVNGRIIYTIDSLDTEDIEDIDSAISGLQMLYQGGCGAGTTEAEDAAHIVCSKVESAVSKESEKPVSKLGHSNSASDALYSFVYQPAKTEAIATASSSFPPLSSVSTGTSGTTTSSSSAPSGGSPVEPFDYSLKFTSTGASLFEPGSSADDNEEEDLELLGISASTAGIAGIKAKSANPSPETRPDVSAETKLRASTSAISLLADSSSDRINQRLQSLQSEDTSLASSVVTVPKVRPDGIILPSLSVSDMSSTASKEAFWNKHRSNVMIVKEQATFCLKERVPLGKQVYKVKGTLTLHLNADKKVKRIELLNSFDTSMHR